MVPAKPPRYNPRSARPTDLKEEEEYLALSGGWAAMQATHLAFGRELLDVLRRRGAPLLGRSSARQPRGAVFGGDVPLPLRGRRGNGA
eukprot:377876-Pyramimonas_sp.AAC.3